MPEIRFTRLLPGPAEAVAGDAFLAARPDGPRPPGDRPWVMVNFVTSLDGGTGVEGRSAPLSDPGDRVLFHALRAEAGAIMAGTGTLSAERYRAAGKPVVTISRSGRLPREIPLMRDPAGELIAFCGSEPDLTGVAARVQVEALGDLAGAMARLRDAHGIDRLLCEGGPSLFGALLRAGLVDELFLTLGPKLVGGEAGLGLVAGDPPDALIPARLASVLEHRGTLYLRYVL